MPPWKIFNLPPETMWFCEISCARKITTQKNRCRMKKLKTFLKKSCVCRVAVAHCNTDVLRKIGWPTLAWRRRRKKLQLLLLWDLLHGSGPPNLRDQVSSASTRAQYCLRSALISGCSSLPYCPSSKVFSCIYCDAFQFLAILCCLLFF